MKTIIEINGRKYDAKTGKLLESNSIDNSQVVNSQPSGSSIDGVSRHKQQSNLTNLAPHPTKKPKPVQLQKTSFRSIDIKPLSRKPQKSKTLLRTAVKKPAKQAPKVHETTTIAPGNIEKSATGRGVLLRRIPIGRLERAADSTKSSIINRFDRSNKVKPQLTTSLSMADVPVSNSENSIAPPISKNGDHKKDSYVFNHPNSNYHAETHSRNNKTNIRKRLASSFSVSQKFVAISAAVIAIIILGGFLAYQNVPSVGMKVAASKAGFSGKLPNSTPAGYAFKGPIIANEGNIVLTYKSNSDSRKFIVSQKPTSWTSESLLTNYLVDSKLRYQTYHDKGMTVYIYNESNATWVDKGIWYTVNGDGSLSSEQILEIASSI